MLQGHKFILRQFIANYILNDENNYEDLVNECVRKTFKPEFINRIDEIITFKPLNKDTVYEGKHRGRWRRRR